jgi:hypothetical protein
MEEEIGLQNKETLNWLIVRCPFCEGGNVIELDELFYCLDCECEFDEDDIRENLNDP